MAQYDNQDQSDDQNEDMGGGSEKPRKKRAQASSGTNWGKIILIMLGIGGVSLALCCGVGYYFASKAFNITEDPAKISEMQKEIVAIEIPANMQPKAGMNMNLGVMTMKMVMYSPDKATSLMLMEMNISGQTEEQMQQAFKQQAGQQQQNGQFNQESAETKTVMIDGQERSFNFAKGTMTPPGGQPTAVHLITGMFPSKNGMGFIQYAIDDTTYDEAAVIKTLESIHK